jgi:hypothetical protein
MLFHIKCHIVIDYVLRVKFFIRARTTYVYCAQNLKITRQPDMKAVVTSHVCSLVVFACTLRLSFVTPQKTAITLK